MVDRIKERCRELGITVAEAEKDAEIPENSIYKWDKHDPSVRRVARVAKVLDTTIDDLIGEGDENGNRIHRKKRIVLGAAQKSGTGRNDPRTASQR